MPSEPPAPSPHRDSPRGGAQRSTAQFDPASIERPDPRLLTYYLIVSLASLIFAPIVFLPLFLRYKSLRYRVDRHGISMRVGVLFRQEVHLTYRRIQDIHVTRGLLQRWLGLATISLQTASGSAAAEMQIEGVLEADALRDWLYARMRGAAGDTEGEALDGPAPGRSAAVARGAMAGVEAGVEAGIGDEAPFPEPGSCEATRVLREILLEVRALRERLDELERRT